MHRVRVVRGADAEGDRPFALTPSASEKVMVVKKNQALPTAEILLIDSSAVKSLLSSGLK